MSSFSPFGVGQASTIAFSPPFQPFYPFAKPKRSLGPTIDHVADSNARLSLTAEGVVVSGAGTSEANGLYTDRGVDVDHGRHYYTLTNKPSDAGVASIRWVGDSWSISSLSGSNLYESFEDVVGPWLATFSEHSGSVPVPTVTHSPGQVTGAGYQVIQDTDLINGDGTTYTFNGDGADADAGLLVTGAGTEALNDAYSLQGPSVYSGINNGTAINNIAVWAIGNSMPYPYVSSDSPTYPWDASWTVATGDPPPPTVQRNPIASEANWSHP